MADRQSQGLQIALIASVMLNIVVGVVAYLMWRQYDEARAAATASDKTSQDERTKTTAAQADATKLKEWIGFASTDTVDAIGKVKDDDMNRYAAIFGPTYPAGDRVYRTMLNNLANTIRQRDEKFAQEQEKAKAAETERDLLRGQLDAKIKAEQQSIANERTKRDELAASLQAERDRAVAEQNKLVVERDKAKKDGDDEALKLRGTITAYDSQLKETRQIATDRDRQLQEKTKQTFETALGRVISVNQAANTAYINLGEGDALNRLTTFTVYDANTSDVTRGSSKATLEVTQLLGPHMAEARILDGKYGDPVLAGDVIYTPIWKPGQRRHFALAGLIDVDGDNRSDLELVRRLIATNGGVVDSFRQGDQRTGDITARTDYLVIGKRPDETSSVPDRDDFTNVLTQADRLLIKQVNLKDFLEKMGWRPETNLQRYGPGYRAQDFRPRSPEGARPVSTGNVSPLFKPSQPRGGATGTY